MKFFEKNKKLLIILSIILLLLIGFLIFWKLYFSKYLDFKHNEKTFYESVERFYKLNKNRLPGKGESRKLTLQDMYDGNHLDDLKVSNKMCDSNSWVLVYHNEKDEYIYKTYLKCGNFQSKIDHTGPMITLNGSKNMTVSINTEYKEPGVSVVMDNKDGNIDINKVIIDNSKVDTTKLGRYIVTYTVVDSNYNKTVVERVVTVAKNLTTSVLESTDDSNYYKGSNPNNYILFSGMLFRIVNALEDGSIRIVSNDNIANLAYGNYDNYDNSNVNKWLNNYYYSYIHDNSYLKKNNKWCIGQVSNINNLGECSEYSNEYAVGLLSIYDYYNSSSNKSTYLYSPIVYSLATKNSSNSVYIINSSSNNIIDTLNTNTPVGIRPVLVLRDNLYLTSGDGTVSNPYKLDDYFYGSENDLLNTRLVGEFVSYFGMLFRIADFDKDGNVKLVSEDFLTNRSDGMSLYAGYNNIYKFDPSEEGNIGNKLNDDYLDYVDEKYIISHEFDLPNFDPNTIYSNFTSSKFTAKVSIPSSYEMFSGMDRWKNYHVNYWLLDYIDGNSGFFINSSNGYVFTSVGKGAYSSNGFKIAFYVSKDVKIKSGIGTINNPYIIK